MTYSSSAHRVFQNLLATLDHLVRKAEAAELDDEVLESRLTDDMFPLELQFRVALNQVLLALDQVAGKRVPLEEAAYRSFPEIRERIAAIGLLLDEAQPQDWRGAEEVVDLTLPNGVRFVMSTEEDIEDWLLPNCYFHVTIAYALLRKAGLALGKMDFLPHMDRHRAAAA